MKRSARALIDEKAAAAKRNAVALAEALFRASPETRSEYDRCQREIEAMLRGRLTSRKAGEEIAFDLFPSFEEPTRPSSGVISQVFHLLSHPANGWPVALVTGPGHALQVRYRYDPLAD